MKQYKCERDITEVFEPATLDLGKSNVFSKKMYTSGLTHITTLLCYQLHCVDL